MSDTQADIGSAMKVAVLAATKAPSIHNTQPWRFHIEDDRIQLMADFARQLDVLDPTRRQLFISCGAALHHLRVALRGRGYDTFVTPIPDDSIEHLVTVVVRAGQPPSAPDRALAAAIEDRHSQRAPFAGRQVQHETLAELRVAAEAEGAWLAILQDREDEITLAVLLSHADAAENADPAYRNELQSWRRSEPAPDGLSDQVVATTASSRHSEVPLRDFTGVEDNGGDLTNYDDGRPRPDEKPALVILGTDDDTPAQWLLAGQALSHVLLQATELGLRASMLGQVIDLPGTRGQLRTLLRLIGEPQMVLRIGYGPLAPPTPRRPLSDVLG
jgi:hypothetical protein